MLNLSDYLLFVDSSRKRVELSPTHNAEPRKAPVLMLKGRFAFFGCPASLKSP